MTMLESLAGCVGNMGPDTCIAATIKDSCPSKEGAQSGLQLSEEQSKPWCFTIAILSAGLDALSSWHATFCIAMQSVTCTALFSTIASTSAASTLSAGSISRTMMKMRQRVFMAITIAPSTCPCMRPWHESVIDLMYITTTVG